MPTRLPGRREPHAHAADGGWARALALLGRRALSAREVDARLAADGVEPARRRETVARLVALHLLDDLRLAEQVAESEATRGRGPRALAARLRRRGLDPRLLDARGGEGDAAADERSLAARREATVARLLSRRFPRPGDARGRARALRWLAGRGFDGASARRLLAAHLAALPPEVDAAGGLAAPSRHPPPTPAGRDAAAEGGGALRRG